MGFFSDLFGGTDRSAQKGQIRANAKSGDFIEQQSQLARGDLLSLFGDAEQATRAGTQAGLDVLGQTIPQQFSAFQQGNLGAQNLISNGVSDARAALLGLPIQRSFRPQAINVDTAFAQQQLPQASFQGAQPVSQGLQGLTPEIVKLLSQGNF